MPPKKSKLQRVSASIAKIFKKKASLEEVEDDKISDDAKVPSSPQVKRGIDVIEMYDPMLRCETCCFLRRCH